MESPKYNGQLTGNLAEQAAQHFLEHHGFRCIARNYKTREGEIDIIAGNNTLLIFVEVRLRQHNKFGGALASVTRSKQEKLIRTAGYFLAAHPEYSQHTCRFDVIAFDGAPLASQAIWITAAFDTNT